MAIKVYGTDWCHDTQTTRNYLDRIRMPYDYIDIDKDQAGKKWVIEQNYGKQKTPTVEIEGKVMSVPSNSQIEGVLQQLKFAVT